MQTITRPALDTLEITQVAHEANRAYQAVTGETPFPAWADYLRRDEEHAEVLMVLNGATAEDLWAAWAESKRAEGWTHGEHIDADAKTHPALVERYEDLSEAEKRKDALFFAVIRALA